MLPGFMETSTETHFFRKEGQGQTETDVPVLAHLTEKTCWSILISIEGIEGGAASSMQVRMLDE